MTTNNIPTLTVGNIYQARHDLRGPITFRVIRDDGTYFIRAEHAVKTLTSYFAAGTEFIINKEFITDVELMEERAVTPTHLSLVDGEGDPDTGFIEDNENKC